MIAIIDYGMGNLRSVQKALEKAGAQAMITQDSKEIQRAEKVVLPGVGAIKPAIDRLHELDLVPMIKEAIDSGKPFLGICLGFQLLFEKSTEGGDIQGLNILPGIVERFSGMKVPHMGWNQLHFKMPDCPLWNNINEKTYAYFCHSFYVNTPDSKIIAASTDYGIEFTSAVWSKNVFGVQFHPEKSQKIGLQMLKNFTEL